MDRINGSRSRSGSVTGMAAEGEGNGNGGGGGCSCLRRQQAWSKDSIPAFAYRERGMLKEKYVPVWECGAGCGCGEGCRNRVVQKGRKINIRIQKTEKYGWGTYAFFTLLLSLNYRPETGKLTIFVTFD